MSNSSTFPISLGLTVLALIVVLAVAWFSLRFLASMGKGTLKNGRMKVLQSLPLGTRERLMIVEVDGEEYVLGVTAQCINRLDSGGMQQTVSSHAAVKNAD